MGSIIKDESKILLVIQSRGKMVPMTSIYIENIRNLSDQNKSDLLKELESAIITIKEI